MSPGRPSTAFTMVELLVTISILIGLVGMASALYSSYVRDADLQVLKQNLFMMRSAIQHFYLDHGRYPVAHGTDLHGNRVSFLDNATSEVVQGVHAKRGAYPGQRDPDTPSRVVPGKRIRYLTEIPIDPTTNLPNWEIERWSVDPTTVNPGSTFPSRVVTHVTSANPEFAHL